MNKIVLNDGKYTFYTENDSLFCLRYGENWREFVGDNAVHALFQECLEREEKMETKLRRLLAQLTESQQRKFHRPLSLLQQTQAHNRKNSG